LRKGSLQKVIEFCNSLSTEFAAAVSETNESQKKVLMKADNVILLFFLLFHPF